MTDFRALCAELVNIATAHCHPDDDAVGYCAAVLTRARAALAQPGPEEQVLARVEFAERKFNCPSDVVLRQYCDDWFYGDPERSEVDPVDLCRGAIKLFAQIPAPIPLSERLPGPEDCDAEGGCWLHHVTGLGLQEWHFLDRYPSAESYTFYGYTHWLPHWALPTPNQEAGQ